MTRAHIKILPARVAVSFVRSARRGEETVVEYHGSEAATPRYDKTAATLWDTGQFPQYLRRSPACRQAGPRSTAWVHLRRHSWVLRKLAYIADGGILRWVLGK